MAKTKKRYNKKRKTKSRTLRKMRGGSWQEYIIGAKDVGKLETMINEEERKGEARNRLLIVRARQKITELKNEKLRTKLEEEDKKNREMRRVIETANKAERDRKRDEEEVQRRNDVAERRRRGNNQRQQLQTSSRSRSQRVPIKKIQPYYKAKKEEDKANLFREILGNVDMGDGVTHQGVQNVMRKANESGRLTDDRNKFITRHMSKLMKNCEDENVRLKQNYDEELRRQEAAATEAAAKKAAAHEKALAEAQQKAEDDKSVIHRQAEALVNKIIKGRDNAVKKAAEAKQALLQAGEQVAALRMRRSGAQTLMRKLADATDKINDMENEKAALKKELHEASIAINQCNQEKAVAADQCDQEKKAAIAAAKAAAMRMNIGKRLQDRGGEEEEKAEYDRDPANVKLQNYIDDDSANTEKYADIPFDENRANSGWIVENINGGRRRRRTRHRRQQKKKVMKSRKKHRKNKRKTNKKTKRKNKLKYKK